MVYKIFTGSWAWVGQGFKEVFLTLTKLGK